MIGPSNREVIGVVSCIAGTGFLLGVFVGWAFL